ncbi:acyloxyacyl hydrolase [Endozoicomonas atrinae]|uniref:acyloxyacyl hydrolase n=1 Tax=Endozoicomonas atrinae TaxID=1333660 RepID=UPI0008269FB0|nr:acyloxyacyl hydrolase [Endozoicomonas atrinae]
MEKGSLRGFALAMAITPALSSAYDLTPDGAAIGYGHYLHNKAELNDYRASLRWDWNRTWFEDSDTWQLTGFSDLAVNFWASQLGPEDEPSPDGAADVHAISFSPVFRLEHNTSDWMRLFVDAGVGLSYQSKKDIEKKLRSPINMGGHTQFEIRTLLGGRFGGQMQYELSAGWFHYSNAHIHPQNEGLDFGVVQFGYWW